MIKTYDFGRLFLSSSSCCYNLFFQNFKLMTHSICIFFYNNNNTNDRNINSNTYNNNNEKAPFKKIPTIYLDTKKRNRDRSSRKILIIKKICQ